MFTKLTENVLMKDGDTFDISSIHDIKEVYGVNLFFIFILCLSPILIPLIIIILIGLSIEIPIKRQIAANFKKNLIPNSLKAHLKKLEKEDTHYYLADSEVVINYHHSTNLTLLEFIKNFLFTYNNIYCTREVKTNYFICGTGRRRSLGDIYLICKNYYPKCTIEDVLKILIQLNLDRKINTQFCGTINKQVFFSNQASSHNNRDCQLDYCKGLTFQDIINFYTKTNK